MKHTPSLVAFAMCLPLLWGLPTSNRSSTLFSSKKSNTMIIEKQILIEGNVEAAWQVLGPQFPEAYKWASAVHHSEGSGAGINGAVCSERGCSTVMGAMKERLIQYAPAEHLLEYEVAQGMPSMVKHATNYWQLSALPDGKTRLQMRMEFQLGGVMGVLMKPMMRMKLSKLGDELAEEFKYYVETGKPHPRKVKAMRKSKS